MAEERSKPVNFQALAEPFPAKRVRWRVGQKKGNRGMVLAYLDARDVMERLDDVVGPENWGDTYTESPSGRVFCTITIKTICCQQSKTDGAGDTAVEGEKGAISDAFKRAAVKWGIGRYLYECKAPWIELVDGKIPANFDGSQYLMSFSSKQMKTKIWKALRRAANDGDAGAAREVWDELTTEQQQEIWYELGADSHIRSAIKDLLNATEEAA